VRAHTPSQVRRSSAALLAGLATALSACGSTAGADGSGPNGGALPGTSATGAVDPTGSVSGLVPATPAAPRGATPIAQSPATRLPGASSAAGVFHGILQFNGTPRPDDPVLAGALVVLGWSQVEPRPGAFDWSAIDQAATLWAARGKRIAIRVQTFNPHHEGIPAWLPAMGARTIIDGDGNTAPLFWDPLYLARLQLMVNALAARYDGDPRVLWVQAAVGLYGETKVDVFHVDPSHDPPQRRQAWFDAGYTDSLWLTTMQHIVGDYLSAFHHTPLVTAVEPGFIGATPSYTERTITAWLADHGVGTQHDGLKSTTTNSDPNIQRTVHVEEQYLAATKTGDDFAGEMRAAMAVNAAWILVYGQDLENRADRATLQQVAATAT
jgi:hypothetical protein